MSCHFLLQEIFPTQGLNPGLLHCRQTLYCLSHHGSGGGSNPVPCIGSAESRPLNHQRSPNDGHSDWCEVCSFHLHLSKNWWCWASFHMPVAKWMSSLRNVCLGLLPIFWLGCFCCWVWTACVFYRLRTEVLKVRSREPRLGQETPWNCFYNSSYLPAHKCTLEFSKGSMTCYITLIMRINLFSITSDIKGVCKNVKYTTFSGK